MYLSEEATIAGAHITTYMLEKSRVSHVPNRERNYHIFYDACEGLRDQKDKYLILPAHEFKVLNVKEIGDTEQRKENIDSFIRMLSNLGFNDNQIESILKTLFAILHLGNITFSEVESVSQIDTPQSVESAASLLSVDADELVRALTTINVKGVVLSLNQMQSELARDSLMQNTFEKLFNHIVSSINPQFIAQSKEYDLTELVYMGFLDLSGYESLDENSLEQLTINHTNDVLQQLFNDMIYEEQKLYKKELGWDPIIFDMDLKNLISLLDDKHSGFFKILNDVCYRQDAGPSDFIAELELLLAKNINFKVVDRDNYLAEIGHAPSTVIYNLSSFLNKNRNLLSNSLESLLQSSKSNFIAALFTSTGTGKKTSVASFHLEELHQLIDDIQDTDYSFIKCIKPNSERVPGVFDSEFVKSQVKWSGILETLNICSHGYPIHYDFKGFVKKFGDLNTNLNENTPHKDRALELLSEFLSSEEYAVGTTKVFLSKPSHYKLIKLQENKTDDKTDWLSKTKSALSWLFGRG